MRAAIGLDEALARMSEHATAEPEAALLRLLAAGTVQAKAEWYVQSHVNDKVGGGNNDEEVFASIEEARRAADLGYFMGVEEVRRDYAYDLPARFWGEVARGRETGAVVAWGLRWARYNEAPFIPEWPPKVGDSHLATGITLSAEQLARALQAQPANEDRAAHAWSAAKEAAAAEAFRQLIERCPAPLTKEECREVLKREFPAMSDRAFRDRIWPNHAPVEWKRSGPKSRTD